MRFDLYLNISFSVLSGKPGGLPAFTADLRDAVALAFKVGNAESVGLGQERSSGLAALTADLRDAVALASKL